MEPSSEVIGQMLPGVVICGDKRRGSMVRIIRTDVNGKVELDHNSKPQPCGWVMLQQKVDDRPQFEIMPSILNSEKRPVHTVSTTENSDRNYNAIRETSTASEENSKFEHSYADKEKITYLKNFKDLNKNIPRNVDMRVASSSKGATNSVSSPTTNISSLLTRNIWAFCKSDQTASSWTSEGHSPVTLPSDQWLNVG